MSPCFCPSSSLFCSSSQIRCLSPLPSGCGHILSSFSCRSPFLYPWPLTPSAAPSPSLFSDAILAPCPISTVPIVVLCPHPGSLTHLIPLSPFQSLVPHPQVSIQSPSKLLDWLCPLPLCLPPPCTYLPVPVSPATSMATLQCHLCRSPGTCSLPFSANSSLQPHRI